MVVAIRLTGSLHRPLYAPCPKHPQLVGSRGASTSILPGLAIQKPHLALLSLWFLTSLLRNPPMKRLDPEYTEATPVFNIQAGSNMP